MGTDGKTARSEVEVPAHAGKVWVHYVSLGDDGSATVVLSHWDFPELRFEVALSPGGEVLARVGADRRFYPLPDEPDDPTSPYWGPFAHTPACLPFREIERAARLAAEEARLDFATGRLDPSDPEDDGAWLRSLAPIPEREVRRGRKPLADRHLRDVAAVHRWATAEEVPPVRAVADEFGVSRHTAKMWVRRARERGLLEELPRA